LPAPPVGEVAEDGSSNSAPAPENSENGSALETARIPEIPSEPVDAGIRMPPPALEPAAALLGWLSLAALGAAGLAAKIASHSFGVVIPWAAVFVAGVAVSLLLASRRRSSHQVRQLLAEVQSRHPAISSSHRDESSSNDSSRRSDEYVSELLERITSFVGGRASAFYVLGSTGRQALRTSDRMDLTSRAVTIAIEAASQEARPVAVSDDADHRLAVLAAPLVIADRVTSVLVVSAPRRWSRTRRLPKLQQVADAGAAVIERARLGEEEWRNRLGVAHARGHLAILAEAAVTLSERADSTEESFSRLARVIVPDFADWFAVHLDDGSGRLAQTSGGDDTHAHPDGEALVRSAMATGGAVVSSDLAAGCAEPGRMPGTEPALSLIQASPTERIGSLMVVPVEIQGRPVGALSFVTFPGRRGFRPSDLEVAGTLAGAVASTAERALLLRQGRTISKSAERRAERLRRLVETALVAGSPLSEQDAMEVLAEHTRRVLQCERVLVTSRRQGFSVEISCPPGPTEPEIEAAQEATSRVLGASRSAQASSSMGVASFRIAGPETNDLDWVAAPVDQAAGATRRAMVAIGNGAEPFGSDDEAVMALLARMSSAALERAILYETLRSNEQRLTALVESSPVAIAELDLDGGVRWWNRAAGVLFGWDDSGPAPRAFPVAIDPAILDSLWERARLGQATVGAIVTTRRPGGELMELSISVAPLEESDGSTGGILAVAEDATEREHVLEQFHRSERLGAMARLAGGIAHDFNNLVTVILGSSETLMRRIDPDDPLRVEVEAIHRVGKRAAALTGRLLQIGHRSSLTLVETDVAEVISQMSDEIRRLMGSHIDVAVSVPDESPMLVLVDRAELERALLNLAFNARDAMPQGGKLAIATRVARDEPIGRGWVLLSVSDTGIGMDPGTVAHCFEPFFTTKGTGTGTGLGLATVHAVVTQSNGSVNVESSPGVGTTFTLRFPLAGTNRPSEAATAQIGTAQIGTAQIGTAQASNR
jgi:PAS domain S-box-containing protein